VSNITFKDVSTGLVSFVAITVIGIFIVLSFVIGIGFVFRAMSEFFIFGWSILP
jgi:hypothetical protein